MSEPTVPKRHFPVSWNPPRYPSPGQDGSGERRGRVGQGERQREEEGLPFLVDEDRNDFTCPLRKFPHTPRVWAGEGGGFRLVGTGAPDLPPSVAKPDLGEVLDEL